MTHDFCLEGGCACGEVRYRLTRESMFVHGCHCTWCQRETGSAFVVNALIESTHVEVVSGAPNMILTPSASGNGQKIVRCPTCQVAVWSHYSGMGEAVSFVRVGTADEPHRMPPRAHVYTSTKQPWVLLPDDIPVAAEFYDPKEVWSAETLGRMRALRRR